MGAMKELYMEQNGQMLHRLVNLKLTLATADTAAEQVRIHALRDYSSDEPYQNAAALSAKVASALSMVEIMLEDMGVHQ